MGQTRIDIQPRRKSEEELNFNQQIQDRKMEILDIKKEIRSTTQQMRQRIEAQRLKGLRFGESNKAQNIMQAKIKRFRDQILRLQREIISLEKQRSTVTRECQKQKDLF